MANNNDIDIVVKVDAAQANATLKSTDESIKKLGTDTEAASGGFSKFEAGIVTATAAAALAGAAVAALTAAMGKLVDGIKIGDRAGDISGSFYKLADSAGVAGDALLNKFGNALDHTVSKVDQMKTMNELMLAGIDPSKFDIIGRAARSLGEATGTDAAQGIEMMSNALLRGQTRALKAAGIFVDSETAIINYAFANKKASESAQEFISTMGEEEKAAIVRNAIFDKLIEKQDALGTAAVGTGEAIEQISKAWEDAITEFWIAVEANGELRDVLIGIAAALRSIDMSAFINYLSKTKDIVLELNPGLKATLNLLSLLGKEDSKGAGSGAMIGVIKEETVQRNKLAEQIKKTNDEARKAAERLREDTKLHQGNSKAVSDGSAALRKEQEALKGMNDAIDAILYGDAFPKVSKQIEDIWNERNILGLDAVDKKFKEIGASAVASGMQASDFANRIKNVTTAPEFGPANMKGIIDWEKIQDNATSDEAGWEQTGAQIASTLFNGISGGMKGSDWQSLAGDIGGQLGAALGTAVAGPIGGAVGQMLGEVVFEGVFDAFSSENAGSEGRKAVNKYFNEIFASMDVTAVIDGQLQKINDLIYEGASGYDPGGKGWAALQGLESSAQDAFNGIGAAYEQILEEMGIDTESISGQLGAIFAETFGGSISNLRAMLKAAGKDAAELGTALMKAFLQGKMSAEAYMKELQAIAGVMDKSVSRAVESVGEEWKKMEQAGWSGGAALLGSISDVGAAAYQMGARTFPQLANIMTNTFGIGADKVTQFMQAMAMAGITSLEQLAKASDDVLAAIAANMESLSVGGSGGYKPIDLSQLNSGSSGGSSASRGVSSGTSAKDKADEALQKRIDKNKSLEESIRSVLFASNDWIKIESDLEKGLITGSAAETARLALRTRIQAALKAQTAAENQLAKDAEKAANGHKVATSVLLQHEAALKAATDAVDAFTKATEDNANAVTIALKPVTGLTDAIFNLGANGALNGGDALNDYLRQFGGDLNSLQVAVIGLGGSFADMQDQAIQSFLNGKTSATEALKAIQDSGQGIPDVFGGVALAMQNLEKFGTKGGRLTIDALKDIAAEGKELGASTLDDIGRTAIAQGMSSGEVQQLMLALQDSGIKTLDELLNASDSKSIEIVAKLDKLKFPFQQTTDETTKLLAQLDELNTKAVKIPVELQITSTYDNPTTQSVAARTGLTLQTNSGSYGLGGDAPGIPTRQRTPGA